MLLSLKVRDLATVEELEVSFPAGFSILTGETGAGKSIIIDAILLILGEKASSDMIRTGSREASIEAEFDTSGLDIPLGDIPEGDQGRLLIQRLVNVQGSGRAYVNGVLVPVRRLREFAGLLVDVYGQNDHVFLLQTENHRGFLDDFLDDPAAVRTTASLAAELRRLLAEKNELASREREREQRLDFLNFQAAEIEKADLKPGEDEDLLRQREKIRNAEKVNGLVDAALALDYTDENSLVAQAARLKSLLTDLSAYDKSVEDLLPGLDEAAILFDDVSRTLFHLKDELSETPADPESVEERLSIIEKLKRKYGPTIGSVLEKLDELLREKRGLESGSERLAELGPLIASGYAAYSAAAARLSAARKKAAAELEKAIEKEISLLGMKRAVFRIRVETAPPLLERPETIRDSGTEDVEFLISPNPGEELRPIRRIASGGELSRIMLGLKSVGREKERSKTLIFDEVDAGIGGRTAESIALKLRELAARHQVLCITHLPQIAASAAAHYHVEKTVEKDRTFTRIERLSPESRIGEIAKLISGSHTTDASLETAREMVGLYGQGGPAGPVPNRRKQ